MSAFFLLTFIAFACANQFTIKDAHLMEVISPPIFSVNGDIMITRRVWKDDDNTVTQNIELVNPDDGTLTPITPHSTGTVDSDPQWARDGTKRVLFLRDGKIWKVELDDQNSPGEAQMMKEFPVAIDMLHAWLADDFVLMSVSVYPGMDFQQTADIDLQKETGPARFYAFDKMYLRLWNKYSTGKFLHLWVASWSNDDPVIPRDIMTNIEGHSPIPPFGGSEQIAIHPSGSDIAYTMQLGIDTSVTSNWNIYEQPVLGFLEPRHCITCSNLLTRQLNPVYSPDGRYVAYLKMMKPGYECDRTRIALFDRVTKEKRILTETWDTSSHLLHWGVSGLFAIAEKKGKHMVYRVETQAQDLIPQIVASHESIRSVFESDKKLYMLGDSMVKPSDIWTCDSDGHGLTQLTDVNSNKLSGEINTPSRDDDDWECFWTPDGRDYYHNYTTGETIWEMPACLSVSKKDNRDKSISKIQKSESHWEEFQKPTYYYSNGTKRESGLYSPDSVTIKQDDKERDRDNINPKKR